jgi:hypothetical protein
VVEQALLLHQRRVGPAQVEAVERQRELFALGMSVSTRKGSMSTEDEVSTVSVSALNATQQPE